MARRTAALAAVVLLGACSHSGGGSSGSPVTASAPPVAVAPSTSSTSTAPVSSPALPPMPVYGTRKCWPIVLVHGFSGFKSIGPVNYWMDIPSVLEQNGFEVFVVQDKAWATVEERAQEAKNQILAQYPDPRVKLNVLGHSMGGLDIRYMITGLGMGDRVVSATTMGTPHHGSSVADIVFGITPSPIFAAVNAVFKLFGFDLTGGKQLTTVYCEQQFNPSTPDDPRVAYFSWTGAADLLGSGTKHSIIEPVLYVTWGILQNLEGDNDGLVSVKSAQWGQFQGVVAGDHLNEVGQPFGITPSAFDYRDFYEKWAEELEKRGFGP